MDYVRVASANEVSEGQIVPIEVGGQKLLLARAGGRFHAAARKCPHLGFNLCRGSIEDGAIVCPLHKAKFDLDSGAIQRDPKLLFIKMTAKNDLAIHPVKVEGDEVFVALRA